MVRASISQMMRLSQSYKKTARPSWPSRVLSDSAFCSSRLTHPIAPAEPAQCYVQHVTCVTSRKKPIQQRNQQTTIQQPACQPQREPNDISTAVRMITLCPAGSNGRARVRAGTTRGAAHLIHGSVIPCVRRNSFIVEQEGETPHTQRFRRSEPT